MNKDILTDNQSLKPILKQYNKLAELECRVEVGRIVDLRDRLAHGKLFMTGDGRLRLVKFSKKEVQARHRVELALEFTESWLNEQNELLSQAPDKINKRDYDYVPLAK